MYRFSLVACYMKHSEIWYTLEITSERDSLEALSKDISSLNDGVADIKIKNTYANIIIDTRNIEDIINLAYIYRPKSIDLSHIKMSYVINNHVIMNRLKGMESLINYLIKTSY